MGKLKEYAANAHFQKATGLSERSLHDALHTQYAENLRVDHDESKTHALMDVLGEKDAALKLDDGAFAALLLGENGTDAAAECAVNVAACTFTLINRRTRVGLCFAYNDEEQYVEAFRRRFYRGGGLMPMNYGAECNAAGLVWMMQKGEVEQTGLPDDAFFVTSPLSCEHQAGVAQLVHSRHWRAFLDFVLGPLLERDGSYKLRRGTGHNFGKTMPLTFVAAAFLEITLHADGDDDALTSLTFSSVEHDKSRFRRADRGVLRADHAQFAWSVARVRAALGALHGAQMALLMLPTVDMPVEKIEKKKRARR